MLLIRGRSLDIYTLQIGAASKDEVADFFRSAGSRNDAAIGGMIELTRRVAQEGTRSLPPELFKCWRPGKKGPIICELRKGRWRIACFPFSRERRLLLVSVFHKGRWKEGREYDRAVKRHNGFVASPEWREEG
jgi:hypothetical protein